MKRTKQIILITFLIIAISCKQNESSDIINQTNESNLNLDFENPKFNNRSEELIYIREYLNQNIPRLYLQKNPKSVKDMQEYYIADRRYYSLEYSAYTITNSTDLCRYITNIAIQKNLSFEYIKTNVMTYIPFDDRRYYKHSVSKELAVIPKKIVVKKQFSKINRQKIVSKSNLTIFVKTNFVIWKHLEI